MQKKVIGVFGAGRLAASDPAWAMAVEVGRLIARADCVLLTGGLGGVMEAASKGAREAGGLTLGIIPSDRRTGPQPNPYIDLAVYTGMGEARNVINVKTCDAAIAIGGEYGTLSEIALALKIDCPLILFDSWSFERRGLERGWRAAGDAEEAVRLALQAVGRP
jgi:uncharacterized protein (TIGR00725 family)